MKFLSKQQAKITKPLVRASRGILFRTTLLIWLVTIFTLGIFVLAIIPYQKNSARAKLEATAEIISTSLKQVTVTSVIIDDYSSIVDHCLKVVEENPSILYLVITPKTGSSFVIKKDSWRMLELSDQWKPIEQNFHLGEFQTSNQLYKGKVFDYTYSLSYSGIEWGWIHVGLSVDGYSKELREIYSRTIIIALFVIVSGFGFSFFFASRLSHPILKLTEVTKRIAAGDLFARVEIQSTNEISSLAASFNQMTEALQKAHATLEQRIKDRTASLKKANEALKEEIAERKQAELAARASEQLYRSLITISPDAVTLYDLNTQIIDVSQKKLELHGYNKRDQMLGKSGLDFIEPADRNKIEQYMKKLIDAGSAGQVEINYLRRDGSIFIGEINSTMLQDADGKPQAIIEICRDITDRKKTEEKIKTSLKEKEVLLQEIHHRVKNNLQVISSLLYLQSKALVDEKVQTVFQECQHRVRSMSLVHEKLYQSKNLAQINFIEYISDLVRHLYHSFSVSQDRIKFKLEGDGILLDIDTAIPCGLIVNELVSNSIKYAFPNGNVGEIKIILDTLNEHYYKLTIGDDGVGLPKTFDLKKSTTLGLKLVNTLVDQLGGKIEVSQDAGVRFEIIFLKKGR